MLNPKKLKKGDTVAVVTPSAGAPDSFPHIYEKGIGNLKKLGFKIKEMPNARKPHKFLHSHPEVRANDVNQAFEDPEVHAIIASIGGDD